MAGEQKGREKALRLLIWIHLEETLSPDAPVIIAETFPQITGSVIVG